jgi:membrane protease YdiL (CAAX protease family)
MTTRTGPNNTVSAISSIHEILDQTQIPTVRNFPSFFSSRIVSAAEFTWIRFRLSMMVAIVALVKAYFQTGTYSLFWEDLLYTMSAAGWPLTVPLSRSIQVLAGHLTWVAAGSTILWAIPRPPPFFRSAAVATSKSSILHEEHSTKQSKNCVDALSSYQWFRMSLTKCNWLWWTIGGYFVSSWLFNIADSLNRYLLPAQVLQDAAESVVAQLVQPEHNDLWASVIGYIAPCITAPVWEELLYRGFLLAGLTAWTGSWHISCVLQAILFSAHHMSIPAALPLAVLGYTWAVLYTHSKNLWTVIAVHAMWNSRIFFGSWFGL